MHLLKRIFNFYVFSNIHVALATFSLTKITLLYLGVFDNILSLFVLFATLLSYNFIRFYRKSEIKSWLYNWIDNKQKLLYTLSFISLVIMIYLGLYLNMKTLVALVPLGFLTLFYALPFWGKRALRALSGFKLLLISFSWAAVSVLLPIINYDLPFSQDAWILFFQRLFFVATITIPFDIRDIRHDSKSLKTLPQIFGTAKSKRIGILLLMLFLGLNFLKENPQQMLTVEFVITLLSLLLLVRSTEHQNKYYSTFFVEAIPIFWLVLVLIK